MLSSSSLHVFYHQRTTRHTSTSSHPSPLFAALFASQLPSLQTRPTTRNKSKEPRGRSRTETKEGDKGDLPQAETRKKGGEKGRETKKGCFLHSSLEQKNAGPNERELCAYLCSSWPNSESSPIYWTIFLFRCPFRASSNEGEEGPFVQIKEKSGSLSLAFYFASSFLS